MLKTTTNYKLIILCILAIVNIAFADSKKKLDANDTFYPIQTQQVWRYSILENGNCFDQHVVCKAISDSCFILTAHSIRKTIYFFAIKKGIVSLTHFKIKFPLVPITFTIHIEPAMPVFDAGKTAGESWVWEGRFSSFLIRKRARVRTHIVGYDKLRINDRQTNCLKMESEMQLDGATETLTAWYAEGIGLVRQESPQQNKLLTEFSLNMDSTLHIVFNELELKNSSTEEPTIHLDKYMSMVR